jgi:hypothetical protein
MRHALPDDQTVRSVIALALRAPSIHNSQPWRWVIADNSVHLFADPDRHLPISDSDSRDLLVSCGAALHHARVAFAAVGWATTVHRLPNPAQPDHLAAVECLPRAATAADITLAAAISHRRTDRRRFSSWTVPPPLVDTLAERAAARAGSLFRSPTRGTGSNSPRRSPTPPGSRQSTLTTPANWPPGRAAVSSLPKECPRRTRCRNQPGTATPRCAPSPTESSPNPIPGKRTPASYSCWRPHPMTGCPGCAPGKRSAR